MTLYRFIWAKANKLKYLNYLVIAFFVLNSCSTQKDKFINRNWHELNTTFNVLYNGNIALETGLSQLKAEQKNNYFDLLPIEPFPSEKFDVFLDDVANDENFERAEEKATKAIQKHSMVFASKQKNQSIENAYFLLGKARYYDQRFVPALEAFTKVLSQSRSESNKALANIWIAKIYYRTDNIERAQSQLLNVKIDRIDKVVSLEYFLIQSQIALETKNTESSRAYLKEAVSLAELGEKKARWAFLLGQLYERDQKWDSAYQAYKEVIRIGHRAPALLQLSAKLSAINLWENEEEALQELKQIEGYWEYISFKPFAERTEAKLRMRKGEDSLALTKYAQSNIGAKGKFRTLLRENYRDQATYFFDRQELLLAANYYDSLYPLLTSSKAKREVSKKIKSLSDLKIHSHQIAKADSILFLMSLNEAERIEFVINTLKKRIIKEQERKQKDLERKVSSGNFYFDNDQRINTGRANFRLKWGAILKSDNWFLKSSNQGGVTQFIEKTTQKDRPQDSLIVAAREILSALPSTKRASDSLLQLIDFQNFQINLLYEYRFGLTDKAQIGFSHLAEKKEAYVKLPARFELYKIALNQSQFEKAEELKRAIIKEFPRSIQAEYLKTINSTNFKEALTDLNVDKDKLLITADSLFQYKKYDELIQLARNNAFVVFDRSVKAQLDYYELLAILRAKGTKAFKPKLSQFKALYPEAEKQKLINILSNLFQERKQKNSSSCYILWRVGDFNEEEVNDLIAEVKNASISFSPEKQDVFIDYFDKEMKIIVLSDFDDEKDASIFLTLNRNLNRANLVGIFKKEEYEKAQLDKKLFSKRKYQIPN
tara:strand:+ start:2166 stop:4652 length:2487 start_codon:yes stop_codon:yes gene_type:complete